MLQRVSKKILGLLALPVLLAGCGGNGSGEEKPPMDNTPTRGTLYMSVDESFKPVIDSQIKVYEASFPNTKIIAEYKPEAECLKDLENDSTKLVIVTRGLSKEESEGFKQTLGFAPPWGIIAWDAIAVITHKSNNGMYTVSEIKNLLLGETPSKMKVVMDGLSATSTVRFAMDSLLGGRPFGTNVVAKKNSREVIEYVASDPQSIGMIGVSWIGDEDDPEQLSFQQKVNVASLKCETCDSTVYVKPYQANIGLGRYPLIRSLNYILKENFNGLGRGFVSFMIYERGQLIFKRAYLLPARMQFEVRNMNIKEDVMLTK